MLDGGMAVTSKGQRGWIDAMIGSAMDAIIGTDHSRRIVVVNAAAERMFGYGRETIMGEGWERLIPERRRAVYQREVERFGNIGISSRAMGRLGEIGSLRANKEEFPIEAAISQFDTPSGKRNSRSSCCATSPSVGGSSEPCVRKIIEQHGGHIWVESEAGKGAAFYFTLPQKVEE